MFPSVERLLVTWLPARIGNVRVTGELPADFAPPIVFVDRIGGRDDDPVLDRPVIDVDYYDATRAKAQDGAEWVRHQLRHELPQQVVAVGGLRVVVTQVDTVVGPRQLPHANPQISRYHATYRLLLHSIPAAA